MHPERDGVQYVKGFQQRAMVKGGTVFTHKLELKEVKLALLTLPTNKNL